MQTYQSLLHLYFLWQISKMFPPILLFGTLWWLFQKLYFQVFKMLLLQLFPDFFRRWCCSSWGGVRGSWATNHFQALWQVQGCPLDRSRIPRWDHQWTQCRPHLWMSTLQQNFGIQRCYFLLYLCQTSPQVLGKSFW